MRKKYCYYCIHFKMYDAMVLACNKHNVLCNSKSSACAFFEWNKKLLKNKLLQDLEKCRVSMLKLSKDMYTLCSETENAWMWQKLDLEADVLGEIRDTLRNVDISNEVE